MNLASEKCTDAERATYGDTRACRELGIVPLGWVEREVRTVHYGEETVRREVVLVLGRPKS